jgi:hypothetical protein
MAVAIPCRVSDGGDLALHVIEGRIGKAAAKSGFKLGFGQFDRRHLLANIGSGHHLNSCNETRWNHGPVKT